MLIFFHSSTVPNFQFKFEVEEQVFPIFRISFIYNCHWEVGERKLSNEMRE